jgi:hypothetical protein
VGYDCDQTAKLEAPAISMLMQANEQREILPSDQEYSGLHFVFLCYCPACEIMGLYV